MSSNPFADEERILKCAGFLFPLIAAVIYIPAALNWFDHNDSMYLAASLMWGGGEALYSDVPFVQAPMSAILPAALKWLVGVENFYFSARLASVVLVFAGTVLLALALRTTGGFAVASLFLALALTNSYVLSAAKEIGSYALPYFLVSLSVFVARCRQPIEARWFLVSVMIGLAASAKLNHLLLLPGLLLLAYSGEKVSRRNVLAVFCGITVGMLPILYFFAKDPQAFLLQNVTFHSLTNEVRGIGTLESLRTIFERTRLFLADLSVPVVLLLAVTILGRVSRKRAAEALTLLLLAYAMAIVPRVLFPQYLAVLAAFVCFLAVEFVANLEAGQRRIGIVSLAIFCVVQFSLTVPAFNFLRLNEYSVSQVASIQERARATVSVLGGCAPRPRVFTTQPAFFLADNVEYFPATAAGPFWFRLFDGLPRGHEHSRDIEADLEAFQPDIVVFGYYLGDSGVGNVDRMLRDYSIRYDMVESAIGSIHGQEIVLGRRECGSP